MLIEIDLLKQGSKRSTLQGQVKSVQAEEAGATNLFQVSGGTGIRCAGSETGSEIGSEN